MNKRTALFIWKSGDRSEDKSRTSDFRMETSPISPVTIKTLVAVKKKKKELWRGFFGGSKLFRFLVKNQYITCSPVQKFKFSSSFFARIETLKRHFEIN